MEELADAIEDAQYVNAIASQDEGPRPVIRWDTPDIETLAQWESAAGPFTLERILSNPISLYLFSSFIKDNHGDDGYPRMNFLEDVWRYQRSNTTRPDKLVLIASDFLGYQTSPKTVTETTADSSCSHYSWKLPQRTEIEETYLTWRRKPSIQQPWIADNTAEEMMRLNMDFPVCSESCIGLKGPVRMEILKVVEEGSALLLKRSEAEKQQQESTGFENTTPVDLELRKFPDQFTSDLFDQAEAVVLTSLKESYWEEFLESPQWLRCRHFLWYRDRPVVPNDFFVMRVLGRGGFGLVNACKKGTSGKLYAMKVMNKRRIKSKKSEQLALNERHALAAVDSNFVISLSYSFQSKDEIYLILDLMTGGDLGFHLHIRRSFSKRECIYYTARIMLGLQHLHDQNYVYRDLKPENCLLADDGRVKITDLGLAVQLTPDLHGAAGTRGYWAPEMLRRDTRGKRCNYTQMVDWFSLGCCLAEFISGTNPFRSEAALQFGQERGKTTKEKAIDCATLEMDPVFSTDKGFDADSIDLCQKLLDKNEHTRMGGAKAIMEHPYFKGVNWDSIIQDRKKPPFIPAKDVNAASQSEIGTFAEDKAYQETSLAAADDEKYKDWDWVNSRSFSTEVLEFLIYERQTGEPLVPLNEHGTCCCTIL